MRDERFIAVHRGGSLSLEHHRLLAVWAAQCAEHVLPLFRDWRPQDERPAQAIEAARTWSRGEISVGDARTASLNAHAAARETNNDAAQQAARAAGHAVAAAHMADHALRAAAYATRAVKAAARSEEQDRAVEQERQWQMECLPQEIRELVISSTVCFQV